MFGFKKAMLMGALLINVFMLSACGGGDDKGETRWLEAGQPGTSGGGNDPRRGQCKNYVNGLSYEIEAGETWATRINYPDICVAWY
jgi:hypothetical protein